MKSFQMDILEEWRRMRNNGKKRKQCAGTTRYTCIEKPAKKNEVSLAWRHKEEQITVQQKAAKNQVFFRFGARAKVTLNSIMRLPS